MNSSTPLNDCLQIRPSKSTQTPWSSYLLPPLGRPIHQSSDERVFVVLNSVSSCREKVISKQLDGNSSIPFKKSRCQQQKQEEL